MSEVACTCFNHGLQFRSKKELVSELEQKSGFPFSMSSEEYDFISAVDNILAMQREAKAKGCAGMTLEEINKEISDYRRGL